jgi:hypothetical protein
VLIGVECMCVFIRVDVYTYINTYVYIVFLEKNYLRVKKKRERE